MSRTTSTLIDIARQNRLNALAARQSIQPLRANG